MKFLKKYWPYLVGAIVAYLIYRIVSNRVLSPGKNVAIDTGTGATPTPAFAYNPEKVERAKLFGLGTKDSQEVAYLQTWLNRYYSRGLVVDGDFGPMTAAALLAAKPTANQVSTSLDKLAI